MTVKGEKKKFMLLDILAPDQMPQKWEVQFPELLPENFSRFQNTEMLIKVPHLGSVQNQQDFQQPNRI